MKNTIDKQSIPENQSRRNFLVWTISHTASAALTLIPSSITWLPGIILVGAIVWEEWDISENEKRPNIDNSVFIINDENMFVNIWVMHDSKMLKYQLVETSMWEKIKSCDILLLEKWTYFNKIAALHKEQESFGIDISSRCAELIVWWLASYVSFTRSITQLRFDFIGLQKEKNEKKDIRKKWLKHILATLGISQLSMFPPSMFYSMFTLHKNLEEWDASGYALKYDISHTGDARTLFMALEVLKYQEKYPNKKIGVVTWAAHAQGINYYLYDAQGMREFKKIIYNIVYGLYKVF